jgi:hypothetical protein
MYKQIFVLKFSREFSRINVEMMGVEDISETLLFDSKLTQLMA